jgi:hypothetical protein
MGYKIPLSEMALSIPAAPLPALVPTDLPHDGSSTLLPPFLSVNSWITYEHDGAYHKGFLTRKTCGMYWFSFKTHVKKESEDWGVDLPNLSHNWVDLCTEGILVPGHAAHSFIRSPSAPVPSGSPLPRSTFHPVANIVRATSEVAAKTILMGHPVSSCHVLVVRSCFILFHTLISS